MAVVLPTGKWWRFSDYEIVDGSIRPAPGAELQEYSPWLDYEGSRTRGGGAVLPYQALLTLLQELDFRPTATAQPVQLKELFSYSPTQQAGEKIVSWCRRYGLLGLLTQECSEIVLPIGLRADCGSHRGPFVEAEVKIYSRTPYGWVTQVATVREAEGEDALTLINRLVGLGFLTSDHPTQPMTFTGRITDWEARESTIDLKAMREYGPPGFREATYQESGAGRWIGYGELYSSFRSMSFKEFRDYPLPLPLSREFWLGYTEPVFAIVHAAAWLRQALLKIKTMEEGTPTAQDGEEPKAAGEHDREEMAWEGAGMLANLTGTVSPVLAYDDTRQHFRLGWIFPSLLSSLAMMITQDLAEDHTLHICEVCGAPFISSAYQALYCSSRCRFRMQKRRQRREKES